MKGRSSRLQSSDPPDEWVNGSWTVDCMCGVNFDDGEEMVNCDLCGVWVHTRCSRYVKGDDNFLCDKCKIKNNRNESEETEVAQFLVELPTKTMRVESTKYAANGPSKRQFRLWTNKPIEERVHVQGIPGGDPALFRGLSSVFTPELWKCTGYVPKKFSFQYKEFPSWDEKVLDDTKNDEENENPDDNGAGVLFSLSKESVLPSPVTTLVGMRGKDEDGACDSKVSLNERKKREGEDADAGHTENGTEKERSLLKPVILFSGKRRKEDMVTSKDRSGKKKARTSEKEVETKRRSPLSSKTVFTPTSDAKQLGFYEDRGPKCFKADTQSYKNQNLRETVVREAESDVHVAVDKSPGEPKNNKLPATELSRVGFASEITKSALSTGDELQEENNGVQVPPVVESFPRTDSSVSSLLGQKGGGYLPVKQEGNGKEVDKSDDTVGDFSGRPVKPPVEDLVDAAQEIDDTHITQDSNSDMLSSPVQHDTKVNVDEQHNDPRCHGNFQSSPHGDAKELGISSDHICEASKVNDGAVSGLPSVERKTQEEERTSEAVGDYSSDKAEQQCDTLFDLKQKFDGPEVPMALRRSSSESKHVSEFAEEQSKICGIVLSAKAAPDQHKTVVCVGKSSSTSSSIQISKASTSNSLKLADTENPDSTAKQRVMTDGLVCGRKEHASNDVLRVSEREEVPRKASKEHQKAYMRTSHLSRVPQDSVSKRTTPDSKDPVIYVTSKASSACNISSTSAPGESTGSLHNQMSLYPQNKILGTGVPQKGEKLNHKTNLQPSSKVNHNHAQTMHPPAPSIFPATLSDEELALLLHQELNSSPRVPRVPRVRHTGSLPQLGCPSATSVLMKRTSSSGGKDYGPASKRKGKDVSRDAFRSSRDLDDEGRKTDRLPSSPDQRRQDVAYSADVSNKREDNGSPTTIHAVKKNISSASTATASSGPSSSTEVNDRNLSLRRNSPRNTSEDETGTKGGAVHHTLPGLINKIMSKGRRMTYEELCNAVLPHWHNLRKHNGERYAYSSHSQAVLDCLRNRHEWARLVDRGPKTSSSRKRRKRDADESEDSEYGKGITVKDVHSKSLKSQNEEVPKGKRKARKRRRLALQGRGIRDIRKRRKADMLSDDDIGPLSNSSEESMFSEDEVHDGETSQLGFEASSSSDDGN